MNTGPALVPAGLRLQMEAALGRQVRGGESSKRHAQLSDDLVTWVLVGYPKALGFHTVGQENLLQGFEPRSDEI